MLVIAGMACACGARTSLATAEPTVVEDQTCVVDYADCDGDPSNGCEIDLMTSHSDCGECGHICPSDLACGRGRCRPGNDIVHVSAGAFFTCALRASGELLCWGRNDDGQLGTGDHLDRPSPTVVAGLPPVAEVSTGSVQVCVRLFDHGVRCWGLHARAARDRSDVLEPQVIGGLGRVAHVRAGARHACSLDTLGRVRCWGANDAAELGDGTLAPREGVVEPRRVGQAIDLAADMPTCARRANGEVTCWGDNWAGAVGDGTGTNRSTPTEPIGLPTPVLSMALGGFSSCFIVTNGAVWCTGNLTPGQGAFPVQMEHLVRSDYFALAVGVDTLCALLSDGHVECSGGADHGERGGGAVPTSNVFTNDVVGVDDAIEVTAGTWHYCALRERGTVSCWGDNEFHHLGNPAAALRQTTPLDVVGLP